MDKTEIIHISYFNGTCFGSVINNGNC